jgi:general stress protein 26
MSVSLKHYTSLSIGEEKMSEQGIKDQAKEIIKKSMFPALTTIDGKGFPQSRAMMPVMVDDDFSVYYLTNRLSAKCSHIAANPRTSSIWVNIIDPMKDWQSVLIKGTAIITDEKALRDKFWMEELRFAFPLGADDPNFVILICKPTEMIVSTNATMPPIVIPF